MTLKYIQPKTDSIGELVETVNEMAILLNSIIELLKTEPRADIKPIQKKPGRKGKYEKRIQV